MACVQALRVVHSVSEGFRSLGDTTEKQTCTCYLSALLVKERFTDRRQINMHCEATKSKRWFTLTQQIFPGSSSGLQKGATKSSGHGWRHPNSEPLPLQMHNDLRSHWLRDSLRMPEVKGAVRRDNKALRDLTTRNFIFYPEGPVILDEAFVGTRPELEGEERRMKHTQHHIQIIPYAARRPKVRSSRPVKAGQDECGRALHVRCEDRSFMGASSVVRGTTTVDEEA